MKGYFLASYNRLFRLVEWGRARFTRAGWMVAAMAGLSGVVGVDTHLSLAYQIFAFLAALLALSMLHGLLFRARFTAERRLPRLGTVGTPLGYRVRITAGPRGIPAGLRLREQLPDPRPDRETFLRTPEPGEARRNFFDRFTGYYRWEWLTHRRRFGRARSHPVPPLAPGATETVRMSLVPRRRGRLVLCGLTLLRPDPLGLFMGAVGFRRHQSLVILPRRHPLPPLRMPGGRRHHAGGVALTSSVGDTEEFVSLREYRPGDPLRRIHWRSWARTGRPVVKEHQEEFFVRHALALDTFIETAESEAFEAAVSVAASFACTVQTQESLLDLLFVGTEAVRVTAGRGLGDTDHTLEVLAGVRPSRVPSFSRLTAFVARRSATLSGCICVLLAWDAPRRELVRLLRGVGVPVWVLVVSDTDDELDPGPLADRPGDFHLIHPRRVAEGLARL
jgi:uncharacterized protein (DUF58 family)